MLKRIGFVCSHRYLVRPFFRYDALQVVSNSFSTTTSTSRSPHSRTAGWSGLGAFAIAEGANKSWKLIKTEDENVESVIERFLHPPETPREIDWGYWEKTIKHKTIVDCLKSACTQQVELIVKALSESTSEVEGIESAPRESRNEWYLFDQAVESCEKAVAASEELVADGAKALWISHRNPPAWTVSPAEWLDSDQWWQAYIERHHHFDPAKDIESLSTEVFESDASDEAYRRSWKRKVDLFHDRSDTPTLYQYMDQLHSFDYYDIHGRVFLEHMLYHLISTGNSHHFFPEIPPSDAIAHIEKLRFRWLSAAHARRKARQLVSYSREEPLDLCLLDSDIEHHGEEHFTKLLASERLTWELAVARLMGDYSFLCYPAIPCVSASSLYRAVAVDSGRGRLFSLGADISLLFYIPEGSAPPCSTSELYTNPPVPSESLEQWMNHLGTVGASINPGYEDLLKIYVELLDGRGHYWFTAPGESVRDAFMRRIAMDDPTRKTYEHYLQELEMLWKDAVEIQLNEGFNRMPQIESETKVTDRAFGLYRECLEKEKSWPRQQFDESWILRQTEGQATLSEKPHEREKVITIIDSQNQQNVKDTQRLVTEMNHFNIFTGSIIEAINAIKLPTL